MTFMNILKFNNVAKSAVAALIITLSACGGKEQGPSFTVTGKIANGEGKCLYFSNIGIKGTTVIDSVKLGKEGAYSFSSPRPECYDFYFIALQGEKPITFAIDSTETITINSDAADFFGSYTVEGNAESVQIKEMSELQAALEKQVNSMLKSTSPAIVKTRNEIYSLIGEFKRNISTQYIVPAPGKATAYYALSLTLNGEPLFQPMNNRIDSKCFAAVATSLRLRFPNAKRTRHMCKIAEESLQKTRPAKTKEIEVGESSITTTGLFDIKLPGVNGDSIALSSLKGKVVLLDFTLYEDAKISSRNIRLREIYSKYRDRGFEIYQISYDTREHFWQQSASNLPWTCVRDGEGAYSSNLVLYNIQNLPTFYLINSDNEITLRDNQITDLEAEIEKLLRK